MLQSISSIKSKNCSTLPVRYLNIKMIVDNTAQRLQTYIHANKSAIDIATRNKDVPMQRPKTAHCVSDQARNRMRTVMGDVPAQATEAWIKLSNDTGMSASYDTHYIINIFCND